MEFDIAQLPQYRCHKVVRAAQIVWIEVPPKPTLDELEKILNSSDEREVTIAPDGSVRTKGSVAATLVFEGDPKRSVDVDDEFFLKHSPKIGGYFVLYEDGYTSFSPAEPFESGYTKIEA